MIENGENVLHRVRLRPEHKPTGRTKHTVGGHAVEPAFELRILQFGGEPGYYLIHYDEGGKELIDTYHDSLEQAMEQAEFEFGIREADWT